MVELSSRPLAPTVRMARTHEVAGMENLPIYLVSAVQPWIISEDDFIDGVTLDDLIKRLNPGQHRYLKDQKW